ncbi:ATP-binding cassette domain-containing protein [Corallococcus exercitus]|uniref:ATP-binding cassette domain-containing protein n=1 Tax=Corallococcus exercitus TaxID=2316736 RepID=UPI0035D4EDC9
MSAKPAPRSQLAGVVRDLIVAAPLPALTQLLLTALNAARPGLSTVITAGFVNGLVQGSGVLPWAVAYGAVALVEMLTNVFSGPAREWHQAMITLRVQQRVLACAGGVPLARHFDPDFHDRLAQASKNLSERLARWIQSALSLIHSTLATAGLLGAIFALGGGAWLAGLLVVSSLAGLLTHGPLARIERERSRALAKPQRLASAWADLLLKRDSAGEVRLFGLGDWLRTRWAAAYRTCGEVDVRAAGRQLRWNGAGAAVTVATYGALLVLAASAAARMDPAQAAGAFAGFLMTGELMQSFLHQMLNDAGSMYQHAGVIGDLAALFAEPEETERLPPNEGAERPVSVTAESVVFRYPGAAADTLKGVSLSIAPGEVVALVGANGAGKSTLASLLLGLHRPGGGSILVDSAELSEGSRGSAVFQHFIRFALPVRDNVGLSNPVKLRDDAALQGVLQQAGSDLKGELDAWLGAEFGGRDLSGGEWLRVAIARGLLARSGLIVLDEPTAAIDPVAEVELVKRLLTLGAGRTAIVVSHRMGIARVANRILVMEDGRIAETGTHAELLAMNGLYAEMWRAQSSWYVDTLPRR